MEEKLFTAARKQRQKRFYVKQTMATNIAYSKSNLFSANIND